MAKSEEATGTCVIYQTNSKKSEIYQEMAERKNETTNKNRCVDSIKLYEFQGILKENDGDWE